MNCKYENHHYNVTLQNKIFFGHDQSLDFFHFILNPEQRRVFQIVGFNISVGSKQFRAFMEPEV
jgi:hypothetical protein